MSMTSQPVYMLLRLKLGVLLFVLCVSVAFLLNADLKTQLHIASGV